MTKNNKSIDKQQIPEIFVKHDWECVGEINAEGVYWCSNTGAFQDDDGKIRYPKNLGTDYSSMPDYYIIIKELENLRNYLRRNNNDAEEDDCTEQQWEDQKFGEYLYNKIESFLNKPKP